MKIRRLREPCPRKKELLFRPFAFSRRSVIYLPIPTTLPDASLIKVFRCRHSSREFKALTLPSLSTLLWIVVKSSDAPPTSTQGMWEHRPTPSAGGRHPVHILALSPPHQNVCLYDPTAHALLELEHSNAASVFEFLRAADNVVPVGAGTLLWFVAEFPKTLSKYRDGESLVWRDAGALLATFSYAAEAMGLNCCALGITGDSWITSLFETELLGGVGGLIVGGR